MKKKTKFKRLARYIALVLVGTIFLSALSGLFFPIRDKDDDDDKDDNAVVMPPDDPEATYYPVSTLLHDVALVSYDSLKVSDSGESVTLNFAAPSGYELPSDVSVIGCEYSWDSSTGKLILSSAKSDVVVTVKAVAIPSEDDGSGGGTDEPEEVYYPISSVLYNVSLASYDSLKVSESGESVCLNFTVSEDYELPSSVTVVGCEYTWDSTTGALTLSSATKDVIVTINAVEKPKEDDGGEEEPETIYYPVSNVLYNVSLASYDSLKVSESGESICLNFSITDEYELPANVTVVGCEYTWDSTTGALTLSSATRDVVVTIVAVEKDTSGDVGSGEVEDERVKYVTFMFGDVFLYKQPVIEGDTARDPVAKGYIGIPTKESTVSTDYTYNGWSLTNGGSADSTVLQNVTEDITVYAAFTSSKRLYTVNLYDGEEIVDTVRVGYGETATFTYTKPGYRLVSVSPSNENITQNTDCYGTWEEAWYLEDFTWAELSELSASGQADKFSVGDSKTITYNGTTQTVTLVGINHDDLAKGSGKAGFTFRFDFLCDDFGVIDSKGAWNSKSITKRQYWGYGYQHSSFYNLNIECMDNVSVAGDISEKLPSDLLSVVKLIKKKEYNWSNYVDSTMCFFIPSSGELGLAKTNDAQSTCYALYSNDPTARIRSTTDGTAQSYWLRNLASSSGYKCNATGTLGSGYDEESLGYFSIYFCV